MTGSQRRDSELATFLRSRRERLRPEEVGLPTAGRRRTQGLRREEVAVLAGVSTTWYTYLEQGRGRNVSSSVLNSLARVLQMSEDERRYMHVLMFGHVADARPIEEAVPINRLLEQVAAIADNHPYPVLAVDRACNLLAWNRAATEWYDDWGQLAERDRNFILWLVTAQRAKKCFDDWDYGARDIVARWRGEVARWPEDKQIKERVTELSTKSEDFARWWADHEVLEHRSGIRRLRHPEFGVRAWRILPMSTFYGSAPVIVFHLPA